MSNILATWPRRYSYQEWRTLPENRKLNEYEAQELFRREALQYTLYEQELMMINAERQVIIDSSFNSLQSYVLNALNASLVNAFGVGRSESLLEKAARELREAQEEASRIATPTLAAELLTENRLLLLTEAREYLITE